MQTSPAALTQRKQRIEFIDLAKGITILLVVMMHSMDPLGLWPIGPLRMPLYFVLSGLFFKDYGGFMSTFIRKANKLIVPFVFFFAIGAVLMFVTRSVWHVEGSKYSYGGFLYGNLEANVPIWFLLCLFWDNIIFWTVQHYSRRQWQIAAACLVIGFVGYMVDTHVHVYSFYFLKSMATMPFFWLGYVLRRSTNLLVGGGKTLRDNLLFVASILLLALAFVVCVYTESPHYNYYLGQMRGNWFLYGALAVVMVVSMLLVCKRIKHVGAVSYIGSFSIIILGLHWPVLTIVQKVYPGQGTVHDFIVFLCVLAFCVAMIEPLRRLAPRFTAQQDLVALRNGHLVWFPR